MLALSIQNYQGLPYEGAAQSCFMQSACILQSVLLPDWYQCRMHVL